MNLSCNDVTHVNKKSEILTIVCLFVYKADNETQTCHSREPELEVGVCDPPLNIDHWLICYILAVRPNHTRPELSAPRASAHFQALAPK